MKNTLKRLLSLAIALVMVIGLLPWNAASVYAAEEETILGTVIDDTYVSSSSKNNANYNSDLLKTQKVSFRTYFRVNVGEIPEGKQITKVQLVLVDTTGKSETGFTIKAYAPETGVTDVAFSELTWSSVDRSNGAYGQLNWNNGNELSGEVAVEDKTITITLEYDAVKEYIDENGNILFAFATTDNTLQISSLESDSNKPVFNVIVTDDESEEAAGSITLSSATLNLLNKVCTIYTADIQNVAADEIAECGIWLYDTAEKAATKEPEQAYETITLKLNEEDQNYVGQSQGIDARDMDKTQYAVAYVKLADNTYIYGTKDDGTEQIAEYSPLIYCEAMKDDSKVGELCRAMMHYGAAAQVAQLDNPPAELMNAKFGDFVYDEGVLGATVFSANTRTTNGMKLNSVTMALKGAISYIVKFTASGIPSGKTLYAEYTLSNGKEGYVELVEGSDGKLLATISDVPAKDLGAKLTVKPYYLNENNEKVYGGTLVFSGYEYTRIVTKNAAYDPDVKELAKALAMYVHHADLYGNS